MSCIQDLLHAFAIDVDQKNGNRIVTGLYFLRQSLLFKNKPCEILEAINSGLLELLLSCSRKELWEETIRDLQTEYLIFEIISEIRRWIHKNGYVATAVVERDIDVVNSKEYLWNVDQLIDMLIDMAHAFEDNDFISEDEQSSDGSYSYHSDSSSEDVENVEMDEDV